MSLELEKVETKVKEIQEQLKSCDTYVKEISNAVEKLLADKTTTINNAHLLSGQLQAYSDVVNALKEEAKAANQEAQ